MIAGVRAIAPRLMNGFYPKLLLGKALLKGILGNLAWRENPVKPSFHRLNYLRTSFFTPLSPISIYPSGEFNTDNYCYRY